MFLKLPPSVAFGRRFLDFLKPGSEFRLKNIPHASESLLRNAGGAQS
jgi:hypothetical protein